MSKFKIKGTCLDMSGINYSPDHKDMEGITHIHTSLRSNNDGTISTFVRSVSPSIPLILSTYFLDSFDQALAGVLTSLGRKSVDLLLIDPGSDILDNIRVLEELIKTGRIGTLGILPGELEKIKVAHTILSKKLPVQYVSCNLCPESIDLDLIEWAGELDLDLIGFNPFGGHLDSGRIIDSYGVPYLLGFSAAYCKLVMVSAGEFAIPNATYLSDLVDRDSGVYYYMNKSVNTLSTPPRQLIKTSLNVIPGLTIPYYDPRSIFSPSELEITLSTVNKNIVPLDTVEIYQDPTLVAVNTKLSEVPRPVDGNEQDFLSVLRAKAVAIIDIVEPGWEMIQTVKITPELFVVTLNRVKYKKKLFGLFKEGELIVKNYILGLIDDRLIFRPVDAF